MAANSTDETVLEAKDEGLETSPLVFQCSGCLSILGDSIAWVCADQNLNTVSLSAVSKFVRAATEDGFEISTEGDDLGSTFLPLQCTSCQAKIGRIYKTTPKRLDIIRDVFTLDCSSIKSYQLGSGTKSKSNEEVLDIPTAQELHAEILKIQSIVIALNERVYTLEGHLTNESQASDQTYGSPNRKQSDTYDRRSSEINPKRHLRSSEKDKLEEFDNGPSQQKRKRVF